MVRVNAHLGKSLKSTMNKLIDENRTIKKLWDFYLDEMGSEEEDDESESDERSGSGSNRSGSSS